jgi:hypothetical protein
VTVIDVHPEDLLDREARGALSGDQRVLLNAHLAHCESCRLERLLRKDFAAEAVRMNEGDMQSFVLGALQRAASGEVAASASLASASAAPSRRRLSAVLALTGVLLVAAGAAASRDVWVAGVQRMFRGAFGEARLEQRPHAGLGKRASVAEKGESAPVQLAPTNIASARSVSAAAAARPATRQWATRGAQAQDDERAPGAVRAASERRRRTEKPSTVAHSGEAASERRLENTYRPAPRTARITNVRVAKQPLAALRAASQKEQARAAAQPAVQPEPLASAPPAPDPARLAAQAAAAALFEQANRARRSGKIADAASLYANLQREFAASAEARLSHAISARMALDAGDAASALAGFERYLAADERALREEAMTGRALALAKLGRNAAADLAFAELLKAYPYSSYAPLAKKRLGQD